MAERFAGVHVGQVDLDERDLHRQQRIAQRHAGVRERRRIYQNEIGVAARLMDAIDQLMLGVGLQMAQGNINADAWFSNPLTISVSVVLPYFSGSRVPSRLRLGPFRSKM